MKSTQPLQKISDSPTKWEILQELEFLHRTLNLRMLSSDEEDLETEYVAGDLGTAADIAAALNLTNERINAILAILRRD